MTTPTLTKGTADLCDDHGDHVQVCEPAFHAYGGRRAFHGPISTVFCFEDNSRVKEAVESRGDGRVLVVAQGPRAQCERLLELLRGGSTPGSVDKVVADFADSGEPMTGFRER
jgi:regulator of RNase E activity RraA